MNFYKQLKERGLKITKVRRELSEVLMNSKQPLSLDQIHQNCKDSDFSSIYRSIKLFVNLGLVEEIHFGDKKPRYEMKIDHRHYHYIRCTQCGKIEHIDGICIVNKVKNQTNYEITNHLIEFTGVCPECKK